MNGNKKTVPTYIQSLAAGYPAIFLLFMHTKRGIYVEYPRYVDKKWKAGQPCSEKAPQVKGSQAAMAACLLYTGAAMLCVLRVCGVPGVPPRVSADSETSRRPGCLESENSRTRAPPRAPNYR